MSNYSEKTGPLEVDLVNDFMFRALLQKNNNVLKALIASLLHMDCNDIESVRIENEIVLGEKIQDKEFILDIRVLMNNHTSINLEMQVINRQNWVDRSTSYLCRTFDSLAHGDDYTDTHPAIQIGLLDYTLFPEAPEFYASYYLMNEKTHQIYSSKLRISVLDLTRIDLATDEDKAYRIDHWAKLFKSQTWEELKMLAQEDHVMEEAVSTICDISDDSILQEQIRAREERLAWERKMQEGYAAQKLQLEETKQQLEVQSQQLEVKAQQLEAKDQQLEVQSQQLEANAAQIAELQEALRQAQLALQAQADSTAKK